MITFLLVLLLVVVMVICLWVGIHAFRNGVLPALYRGAPYLPTHADLVPTMIQFAGIQPTDKVVDLGSGDGRLVIAAAQAGAERATGYEIDVIKVTKARERATQLGLKNVEFLATSFWPVPLQDADVVFIYTLPFFVAKFQKKLQQELKPGARVVTLLSKLPGWKPVQEHEGIRLYQIP